MPASVHKLVYRDPNLEKLAPSKMQIGAYTNDTVKIVELVSYIWYIQTLKDW